MNRTVTWQITIQPWQVSPRVTVGVTRLTYNKHGRQLAEVVSRREWPIQLFEEGLREGSDVVAELLVRWLADLAVDQELELGGTGSQQQPETSHQGDLAGLARQDHGQDDHDEPRARPQE